MSDLRPGWTLLFLVDDIVTLVAIIQSFAYPASGAMIT